MTPRHYLLSLAVASMVLVNGCRHSCCKKGCNNPPVGMPPGGVAAPPNIPAQNIPLDPTPGRASQRPEILLPDPVGRSNISASPMPPAPIAVLGDPEIPAAKVVEEETPAKQSQSVQAPEVGGRNSGRRVSGRNC